MRRSNIFFSLTALLVLIAANPSSAGKTQNQQAAKAESKATEAVTPVPLVDETPINPAASKSDTSKRKQETTRQSKESSKSR